MKAYFDTSALVAIVMQEARWSDLLGWIVATMPRPYVSDFGRGEFISALSLRIKRGEMSVADADDTIRAVDDWLRSWTFVRLHRRDIASATHMVANYGTGLRLPDAIHVAIAERLGCTLVTLDKQQQAGAALLNIPVINPLASGADPS